MVLLIHGSNTLLCNDSCAPCLLLVLYVYIENGITIECAVNRFPRTAEICLVLRPFPQKGLNHEISFFFCDMTIGSLYDFIFRHNTLWKLLSVRLKFIALVQIVERDFSVNPSPKFVHTSMKYLHELINR